MIRKSLLIVAVLLTTSSQAKWEPHSYHPWYLVYLVQGEERSKVKGPYKSKFWCKFNRITIPFGSKFKGCYQ